MVLWTVEYYSNDGAWYRSLLRWGDMLGVGVVVLVGVGVGMGRQLGDRMDDIVHVNRIEYYCER